MFLFCSWCVCFGTLQTLAVCFKKPPSTVFFLTSWCIHTIYVCTYIPVSKIYLLYVHMKSFIILTLFDMEWWDPNSLLLASYWQWAVGSSGLPNSSSISAWIRESFGLCWTLAHRDPKWSEVHQDQNSTCQVFPMNICFFCRFAGSCHARFFFANGISTSGLHADQAAGDVFRKTSGSQSEELQLQLSWRKFLLMSSWCHFDVGPPSYHPFFRDFLWNHPAIFRGTTMTLESPIFLRRIHDDPTRSEPRCWNIYIIPTFALVQNHQVLIVL